VRSTPGSSLHFESGPHPPVDVPDLFAETAMLTGRLDAMLNRLTLEGEGFDDGVARSVRLSNPNYLSAIGTSTIWAKFL